MCQNAGEKSPTFVGLGTIWEWSNWIAKWLKGTPDGFT
ncbi:hypothetical protein Echvi_1245 [Echinicola vietnamensis DSM 17526]|uniref:Uncharacterized protein n=1 Tax=Echinicola vietnamensis (strain DSM 17526 / LMG 23754 / KMM 6221) TaxID=926556 RepID=L0FXR1_ECHVK|nr:hypothetical protein Echvi_1245 [Echinicola vietnamensis DSM 17526]